MTNQFMKPGDLVMYEDFLHNDYAYVILLEEIEFSDICKVFITDSGEVINISIIWLKPI